MSKLGLNSTEEVELERSGDYLSLQTYFALSSAGSLSVHINSWLDHVAYLVVSIATRSLPASEFLFSVNIWPNVVSLGA